MAIYLTGLVTIAFAFVAMFAHGPALAHGGGLGLGRRPHGQPHRRVPQAPWPGSEREGRRQRLSELSDYNPKLNVRHMQQHGRIAPYTCHPVASAKDVDIEHIVAWAEARRSGLSCDRASS